MLPTPSPTPPGHLAELAERIAKLGSETAEVVAETRESIRQSRELLDRIRAAADRDVAWDAGRPGGRSNSSRTTW